MRTTLALVLGMGAVLAAALWTSRWLDPETVASTLADIEHTADPVAPQSPEPLEPVTEVSATWIEDAPVEIEMPPPARTPEPVALEPVEPRVEELAVIEDEELLVTEPFEEAFVATDPHAARPTEEVVHHADDPASSASRIRRMLDVYRRNVQSER